MRTYVIVLVQLMIWSIYSFVKWLSKSDGIFPKTILLLICCYFAILLAHKIGFNKRKSFVITFTTLFLFLGCEQIFWKLT